MAVADYPRHFAEHPAELPGQDLDWLRRLRADALQRFSADGFPTQHQEDWKYTPVSAIERKLFTPRSHASDECDAAVIADLQPWLLADAYRLVFVDGRLNRHLSLLPSLNEGCVSGLAAQLATDASWLQPWLERTPFDEAHGFIHFNNAWFADGAVVHLPRDAKLDKPLQLLFHADTPDSLAVLRNVIVLEAGAEAEIVATYSGNATSFGASIDRIALAEQSRLTLTKLQCEAPQACHFGGHYLTQARASVFEHHNFAFGGLLARTEIHTELAQGSECLLNGLYLAQRQQHLDNQLRVQHREPDTTSQETYKGIVDNRARGVFQGRVTVHPDAQRSNAAMSNRNLLLSADAEVDSKPQLEIYADDVKCSHGVGIGQLDEASVFFLKSRGLDETAARSLLTFAFANEMVDKIANPALAAMVRQQLRARFPGNVAEE